MEQNTRTFSFVLDENEANIVLAGLGKIPAEHSMPIIQKIQSQAQQQLQARAQMALAEQQRKADAEKSPESLLEEK